MLKWIVGAFVVLVLLVAFVHWQRNSVKTAYVNGLAPYASLPGKEFLFERDVYLFKFKGQNSSWPLIGDHRVVPQLPDAIDPKNIGADFPDVRILGIARTGEGFQLVSVRQDHSRTGTRVTFEVLFDDEASHPYPRLDAYWILDHGPEREGRAPAFLTDYVVPHRLN